MSDPTAEDLNVSRETFERLKTFEATILKWNPRINLISRNSVRDLWTRHIIDSLQVFRSIDPKPNWVDIGSGGGFPGVIVAIAAHEEAPETHVTMVESDQRKSAFLRSAARECGISCTVIAKRIEKVTPMAADILSARALADLSDLFEFSERHLSPTGTAIFPKGETWKKEVEAARQRWNFDLNALTSFTNTDAAILKIRSITRV